MDLPVALRRQKEEFKKNVSEDIVVAMDRAAEELSHSKILQDCLQPGDKVPDFILENPDDTPYTLSESLDKGSVVLKFFRGDW